MQTPFAKQRALLQNTFLAGLHTDWSSCFQNSQKSWGGLSLLRPEHSRILVWITDWIRSVLTSIALNESQRSDTRHSRCCCYQGELIAIAVKPSCPSRDNGHPGRIGGLHCPGCIPSCSPEEAQALLQPSLKTLLLFAKCSVHWENWQRSSDKPQEAFENPASFQYLPNVLDVNEMIASFCIPSIATIPEMSRHSLNSVFIFLNEGLSGFIEGFNLQM